MKKNIHLGNTITKKKLIIIIPLMIVLTLMVAYSNLGYNATLLRYEVTAEMEESEIQDYLKKFTSAQALLTANGVKSKVDKRDNVYLLKIQSNDKNGNFNNEKLLIKDIFD